MTRFVLILMVRNEEKIIRRCLEATQGIVDAVCVHDTGSVDHTKDMVREYLAVHDGCLTESVWSDFGTNRTKSFQCAKEFVQSEGWDLKDTYGLLLDGDMVFQPGRLKEQTLTEVGYTVVQIAGRLEYPNCRLVRMDHDWVCRGVTHEYWDGPTTPLAKDICWIDDRNDGGCKSDKFERDARLLEKGLEEDPTNVRYMFYLAQTYQNLGRYADAITFYTKRYEAGQWDEERWYSLYSIAQCHEMLKDPIAFEAGMLRAIAFRPTRAEPYYKLSRYFREAGQHYKAYGYMLQGRSIPKPNDSLFVETDVYTGLFAYEKTILDYYVGHIEEGLEESVRYLLGRTEHLQTVYQNIGFYIPARGVLLGNHPVNRDVAGRDYHPTSTSTVAYDGRLLHNVRFVNYIIDQRDGSYTMKEGTYSASHAVRTQNVLWDGESTWVMKDASVSLPRRSTHILGLEDLRLYVDTKGELRFLATSSEYSESIRQIAGIYDLDTHTYRDCRVVASPTNASCEKNWIPISGTDSIVYRWSPLEVGHLEGSSLVIDRRHTTPWFFQHLRGSASPIRVGSELLFLVHFVEYTQPRKYYHCLVVLSATDFTPRRMSLPFFFGTKGIEYCLSMTRAGKVLECIVSTWDDNPRIYALPLAKLRWIDL